MTELKFCNECHCYTMWSEDEFGDFTCNECGGDDA